MAIGSPKSSSPCWRSLADRVVKSLPTVWSPVMATENPPLPFAACTCFHHRLDVGVARGPQCDQGCVMVGGDQLASSAQIGGHVA